MIKKMAIKLAIILAPIMILNSCFLDYFVLKGRYITNPDKSLKDFKIQFTLQDKDNQYYYYVAKLKEDGSFRIRIKQNGIFIGYISLLEYPRDKWKEPKLSNYSVFYKVNTLDFKEFEMKHLYISDGIKIISPGNNEQIDINSDFVFKWEKSELADFYKLSLFKLDQENKREPVLTVFGIKNNEISLPEIFLTKTITKELAYDEAINLGILKSAKNQLLPGNYGVAVSGYVKIPEQKRFLDVVESIDKMEPFIHLVNP